MESRNLCEEVQFNGDCEDPLFHSDPAQLKKRDPGLDPTLIQDDF